MANDNPLWLDPRCTELDLPIGMRGPFIELGDGTLLTVMGGATLTSADDGKTWSAPHATYDRPPAGIPGLLLRTRDDVIVLVYVDRSGQIWHWKDETGEPAANSRNDVWVVRSLDGGRTWVDRQLLMAGYNGALITMIQTTTGNIVVPVQRLLYDPGRHATATHVSSDNGETWRQGNIIDLGGHGHHDGAYEPTLVELRDGRVWMLIRTNWDRFWEAFSDDGGLYWRVIRPTDIDMSSAPGYVMRLASGRLVLVWNRLDPVGRTYPRRAGQHSATPTSWHREELSIAFSDDDGETWTDPEVFARMKPGTPPLVLDDGTEINRGGLAYPAIFERRPGELWITTGFQGHLRTSLNEADFVG